VFLLSTNEFKYFCIKAISMNERPITLEVETRFFLPEGLPCRESEFANYLNAGWKRAYPSAIDMYIDYLDSVKTDEWLRLRSREVLDGKNHYFHTGKQTKREIGKSENEYEIEAYLEMPEIKIKDINEEIMRFGRNNCLPVYGMRNVFQTYFGNHPIILAFDYMHSPKGHYEDLKDPYPPATFIEVGTATPMNRSNIDVIETHKELVTGFISSKLEKVFKKMKIRHKTVSIYPKILIEELDSLRLHGRLPESTILNFLHSNAPMRLLQVEND
jgi:hypothetical protein